MTSLMALAATLWLAPSTASATETLDIGVLRADDVQVVQKLLYPKEGRTEIGVHLGWMPFDAYLTTPNIQVSWTAHQSETLAFGGVIGGGYGLPTAAMRQLRSPRYGVQPDAYRYLASVLGGVEWAPAYGKVNLNGARIVHYDFYGAARVGATLEQSLIPTGGVTVAPTVSLAAGTRLFHSENGSVRLELRDDVLLEYRKLTERWYVKQNVNLIIGLTWLGERK